MPNKTIVSGLYAGFDGRRISYDATEVTVTAMREQKETTGVEAKAKTWEKGLWDPQLGWGGNVDADFAALQVKSIKSDDTAPFHAFLPPGDPGDLAIFLYAHLMGLSDFGAAQGELVTFNAQVMSDGDPWLDGWVLHNGITSPAVSASGVAQGVETAPLDAGEVLGFIVAPVDPPGASGTGVTLVAVLESDVDSSFTAPAVRATTSTFVQGTPTAGQLQMPKAEIVQVDGDASPITDTWYRVRWTVAGTSPQVYPMVAMGIRPK